MFSIEAARRTIASFSSVILMGISLWGCIPEPDPGDEYFTRDHDALYCDKQVVTGPIFYATTSIEVADGMDDDTALIAVTITDVVDEPVSGVRVQAAFAPTHQVGNGQPSSEPYSEIVGVVTDVEGTGYFAVSGAVLTGQDTGVELVAVQYHELGGALVTVPAAAASLGCAADTPGRIVFAAGDGSGDKGAGTSSGDPEPAGTGTSSGDPEPAGTGTSSGGSLPDGA